MHWSDISCGDRTIRQFAGLWIVFFGALALWQGLGRGATGAGLTWAALALTLGPLGLWQPGVLRPVYRTWMLLAFPLGWVVSHLLLGLLFFGLFTPVALLFRLLGRDALERRLSPDQETYWKERAAPTTTRRYLRQF